MDDIARRIRLTIVLVFVSLTLTACSKSEPQTPQPKIIEVRAMKLELVPSFSVPTTFIGTTSAFNSADLGFELAGRITELDVDVGDQVKQGQKIAGLDTALLRNSQNRINASIQRATTQLELAKRTLRRSSSLSNKSFISEQNIDEQQTQVNQLLAQIEELNAELNDNNIKLDKSFIYAPYEGQVVQKFQSIGNSVAAGQAIVKLNQNHQLQAIIDVPSRYLASFSINQQYSISIQGITYPAKLTGITQSLTENTQTHSLRFELPHSKQIPQNAIATIETTETKKIAGAWIPNESLLSSIRGLWAVYALVPTANNNFKIEMRTVDVIHTGVERSYVTGALNNKEYLLSNGVHKVVPNQVVKLADTAEAK